jgi:hypothetical protein
MKKLTILLFSILISFNSYANFQDGWNAYEKGDYKTAFNEWKPLAEQGDALAQHNLGVMYSNGSGVLKDNKEAVKWYRKAAEQGDASAQYNLGWMYDNGKGVLKDYKKAHKWYTKAAEQGDADAQYNLGWMYDNGEGVLKDYKEAHKWYTKAAEQGSNKAKERLKALDKERLKALELKEIHKAINNIEKAPGISSSLIGKWYAFDSENETEACNSTPSEEIILLHDQTLSRYDVLSDSEYISIPYSNHHFFPKNIFWVTDEKSAIHEYYFETLMFPELKSNSLYSHSKLIQCHNLNNQIGFILLESDAIEFDKFVYSVKNICQKSNPIDCLSEFVDFADVSSNNELSLAELTRFARFVVKWLSLKGEITTDEGIGTAAASTIIAPLLAKYILLNYDYDNDDHIDISEMTYDMVNITGSSEFNNSITRSYIKAMDAISKSKKDASRIMDTIF